MSSPTHEEKRQIFQRHFLFGKLSPNEIDTLISYARVARYSIGREIFAKGSPGQSLMAVLSGSVKISSLSAGGKEVVFAIYYVGSRRRRAQRRCHRDDRLRTSGVEPQRYLTAS